MKTRIQGFVESRWFVALTVFFYLLLAGVLFYVLGSRTKPQIETALIRLIPQTLRTNFLLIAVGIVLCWRDIAGAFRELFANVSRRAGASPRGRYTALLTAPGTGLAVIFIVGFLLVSQVAPQIHRIYYDESIYANMAQNIACAGQAGMANYGTFEYGEYFVHWLDYNKDTAGWPFLMSLVFQLFGTSETSAFYLNNLLFAGGILIVFFIARMLAGLSAFPALLAALIYAIIPHNPIWANTLSAENAAAVFGGLAVLCALAWLKTREPRRLFLVAAVLPFACHMRPESALIAFWAFAAAALNLFGNDSQPAAESLDSARRSQALFRHPFATRDFWAAGLLSFALVIPLILHFYAMSGHSWGAQGAKFATSFFASNVKINGAYFLNNREFPLIFTLLALIGLAAWKMQGKQNERPQQEGRREPDGRPGYARRRTDLRPVCLMLLWFLLFWGIFLFFYAGSYEYGADVRFALVCFMPLAVLAGMGGNLLLERLKGLTGRGPAIALLVVILLISWLQFVPLIRTVGQEAWGARYDHKYAREFIRKIPNRSIVLTHIPTMFLVWGQNAIQAYAGINNPGIIRELMTRYDGHVYFHKSYWCNTLSVVDRSVCDGISQKYNLEPVAVAREQAHEYGLYRLSFK